MPSPAHASLADQERRVLDRFVALLDEHVDVRGVWLYGSRARGEKPHEESDVDLLVITADRRRDQGRIFRLLYEAAVAEGANPAFFVAQVWDPEWLANRKAIDSFFLREVERDKVVLHEKR